jgi:hypothetical protein
MEIVEFDDRKLSPEVRSMLQHLTPKTTAAGAAQVTSLKRALTNPASAAQYLELYERFPNRVLRTLQNPTYVNDQMRRLLNDFRDVSSRKTLEALRLHRPGQLHRLGQLLHRVGVRLRELGGARRLSR